MNKAEKFIQDCTKNCSNVVVYSGMSEGHELRYHEGLSPDEAKRATEIEKDEVIEKMCSFIDNNMGEYVNARDFFIDMINLLKI